jgi:soluble lytic murein transglycosylase-like protein
MVVLFTLASVVLLILMVAVYIARASEPERVTSVDDLFRTERDRVQSVTDAINNKRLAGEKAAYIAQISNLHAERVQQQKEQEATERFGTWGPDLVAAAAMYGQDPAALYRVMICESGGNAYADNGVCKGLFQFNPGTFAGTPYGGDSIFDGTAQIYAAAWMWSQGRRGEWSCA